MKYSTYRGRFKKIHVSFFFFSFYMIRLKTEIEFPSWDISSRKAKLKRKMESLAKFFKPICVFYFETKMDAIFYIKR